LYVCLSLILRLVFFLSLSICPKDTAGGGEVSSPYDVIDVVIIDGKQKSPGRVCDTCQGQGW